MVTQEKRLTTAQEKGGEGRGRARGTKGCCGCQLAQHTSVGRWRTDTDLCSKRKILLIFCSVGTEATGILAGSV